MNRIVRSVLRILAVVALLLAVILVLIESVYTQPTFGVFSTKIAIPVDPARLRAHVDFLCNSAFPRDSDHPAALRRAADYIARELTASGGRVAFQEFEARGLSYTNVVAGFGPESGPVFIVGAHYDSFRELPAADDNASGVAGLLELGHQMGAKTPPVRVELVAYSLEEPPFFGSTEMGSAIHARSLGDAHADVLGMVSLEMIGYFTREQPWNNPLLETVYPTRGDFAMVVGRWQDRTLVRYMQKAMRGASAIRVRSLVTLRIPPVDSSDHRNYWIAGYPAVIVTDTAFIRNPNYHTKDDLPATLDYRKMAQLVEAIYGVTMHLDEFVARRAVGR